MAVWRLVCVEGQHCPTTKPQRSLGLTKRGRPRCEKTVQRAFRLLEELSYASFSHHRSPQGAKDYLVVEWHLTRRLSPLDVPPPSGTENPGLRPGGSPPSDEIPPAPPAENEPPDKPAEGQLPESGEAEQRDELADELAFLEMKLRLGWDTPRLRARMTELRRLARARGDCEPHRAGDEGSDRGCSAP